jgi:hypothetical protein
MIFNMTNGGGSNGAATLNFKVVAYDSEEALLATTPIENTIGVVTTTPITSWSFSYIEPENKGDGMVWFSVGANSDIKFNALKKNELQVYLLDAKQYVGGTFTNVTAMIYQNSIWCDIWHGELYDTGNEYKNVTGGWVFTNTAEGTITKNTGHIAVALDGKSTKTYFLLNTAKKVDVTDFSAVHGIVSNFEKSTERTTETYFGLFDTLPSSVTMANIASLGVAKTIVDSDGKKSIDLGSISRKYYVAFFGYLNDWDTYYTKFNVSEVKMQ